MSFGALWCSKINSSTVLHKVEIYKVLCSAW